MVISYSYKGNFYLNITNQCTNRCTFCIGNYSYVFAGHDLELKREPTKEEVIEDVLKKYSKEKEIVFCGIGEPLMRLDDVVYISQELKKHLGVPIRVDTNGQAKLLYPDRDVVKELTGAIDSVSISLNAENEEKYNKICRPKFPNAYQKMLEFAKECTKHFDTYLSILNFPTIDVEKCREIANEMGAKFTVRYFINTALEDKKKNK